MKIDGTGAVGGAGKVKKSGGTGDGNFSKLLDGISGEKEVGAIGGVSRISAVNFIQAIDGDERSRKRKMIGDGDELLDELLKIRNAILMGGLTSEALRNIQQKINIMSDESDDPNLNEIIEEIKIRAAVELAKLGFYN